MITKRRWAFKSKKQLPLFMVWDEYWHDGEVEYASVVFNTANWILWLPRSWREKIYGIRYGRRVTGRTK